MASLFYADVNALTPEQLKLVAAKLAEEQAARKEYSRKYWQRKKAFMAAVEKRVASKK